MGFTRNAITLKQRKNFHPKTDTIILKAGIRTALKFKFCFSAGPGRVGSGLAGFCQAGPGRFIPDIDNLATNKHFLFYRLYRKKIYSFRDIALFENPI